MTLIATFGIIKLVIFILLAIILGIICYLLIEVVRIVAGFRRLMKKVEFLTDLKSWISVIRLLPIGKNQPKG